MDDYISPTIHFHRKLDEPSIRYLDSAVTILGLEIIPPFRWDGASSPWCLRWLIAKFDKSIYSSTGHDYLCKRAVSPAARKLADKWYKKALVRADKHLEFSAFCGYVGVRTGAFLGCGVHYPHFIKDRIWPIFGIKDES